MKVFVQRENALQLFFILVLPHKDPDIVDKSRTLNSHNEKRKRS